MYIASDDVDTTAKLVTEHGGSIYAGPMDILRQRPHAHRRHPSGGVFGVWQQTGMIGSTVTEEPGCVRLGRRAVHRPGHRKAFLRGRLGFRYTSLSPRSPSARGCRPETFGRSASPPRGVSAG